MSVALLFAIGLFLSAFFSGSETGFYRVTRVRLMLDAFSGDPIARVLLWLTNNPALFVATTLIGNNLANYLTSLSLVLAARVLIAERYLEVAELLTPVVFAPILFVYGELLPKNLFYHAPNFLLRRGGPLFLLFTILFLPLAVLLWILGRILEIMLGQTPLRLQMTLARKELQQLLQEGRAAGILEPAQQNLAQGLFSVASRSILNLTVPLSQLPVIKMDADKQSILRKLERSGLAAVPVRDGTTLAGYVRAVELRLSDKPVREVLRPLSRLAASESHVAALIHLQATGEDVAIVVGARQEMVGVVYVDDLTQPLFTKPAVTG